MTEIISGVEIAKLIIEWAERNNMHPDDFDMLFADELLDALEEDE
jgi:SAM-dependent MidA family methyltransferase